MDQPAMAAEPNDGSISFSLVVTGAGWVRADLTTQHGHTSLSASYLSDALGDLLQAVHAILDGAPAAGARWQEEPGRFGWDFESNGANITLRVLAQEGTDGIWFGPDYDPIDHERMFKARPSDRDVQLESVSATRDRLARAIALGAEDVLIDLGDFGYWVAWHAHPFPLDTLRSIQSKLGITPRPLPEQRGDRVDPALMKVIRIWNQFLAKEIDIGHLRAWTWDQLATGWRDRITHEALQLMNDACVRDDVSEEGFFRAWKDFCGWAATARDYGKNPDEWNREYWMDYLGRVASSVSESSARKMAKGFTGTLSEADVDLVLARTFDSRR